MRLTWQTSFAGAACVGLLGLGAWLPGQEKGVPERPVRPAAKQSGDVVIANVCHANIFNKVTIPAARGGVLGIVKYDVGQLVKSGEMVAKVKDEVALAQFKTAHVTASNDIEIKFAEKSADLAAVEYMKVVKANGVAPTAFTDIEVQRLKLAWDKGLLQKQNAEKDHEVNGCKRDEAGEVLQTHVIQTPMDGLVTKLYKRTGDGVREGEAVMDVVNTDIMRVSGYIPYRDRSRIQIGDLVKVKVEVENEDLPLEQAVFEGKVIFIDVAVQKVKPEVRIYAEVANRDGILCDGLTCNMAIYPGKSFNPGAATTQRTAPKKAAAEE